MKSGLSVWIFSKIVMLVFLFLTFAMILSFMKITNERVAADAADSLAIQIQSALQAAINSPSISSEINVPLPRTLPESSSGLPTGAEIRSYTTVVSSYQDQVISIAIGWGSEPEAYVAATSLYLPLGYDVNKEFEMDSQVHRFFVVTKTGPTICMQGCEKIYPAKEGCTECLY